MVEPSLTPDHRTAAILLISAMLVFAVGGILFTGRTMWQWPIGQTPGYLRCERGFVVAALLVNALGMVLLEELLQVAGDRTVARLALVSYLIATSIIIVAELSYLHNRTWIYPLVVGYVVLACLAQAAFGVALLQTGFVAQWAGWATIVWNVAVLLVLVIASLKDMYFPAVHHVAPLMIGIALLMQA